jgi:hypothetical protein
MEIGIRTTTATGRPCLSAGSKRSPRAASNTTAPISAGVLRISRAFATVPVGPTTTSTVTSSAFLMRRLAESSCCSSRCCTCSALVTRGRFVTSDRESGLNVSCSSSTAKPVPSDARCRAHTILLSTPPLPVDETTARAGRGRGTAATRTSAVARPRTDAAARQSWRRYSWCLITLHPPCVQRRRSLGGGLRNRV